MRKATFIIQPMKGLRRNDDAMQNFSRYPNSLYNTLTKNMLRSL